MYLLFTKGEHIKRHSLEYFGKIFDWLFFLLQVSFVIENHSPATTRPSSSSCSRIEFTHDQKQALETAFQGWLQSTSKKNDSQISKLAMEQDITVSQVKV